MAMSERDRTLVLFIPGLVVVVIFGWFFLWPKITAYNSAVHERGILKSRATQQAPGELERAQLRQLQSEVAADEQELAALRATASVEIGSFLDPTHRTSRVEALVVLLNHHGLYLVEDDHASSSASSLDTVLRKPDPAAEENRSATAPVITLQSRKLHFVGPFASVRKVLEAIGKGQPAVIPVSLTMKARTDGFPEWVLTVLI